MRLRKEAKNNPPPFNDFKGVNDNMTHQDPPENINYPEIQDRIESHILTALEIVENVFGTHKQRIEEKKAVGPEEYNLSLELYQASFKQVLQFYLDLELSIIQETI